MTRLVDIVNFNADGSCLPAASWLGALQGGGGSHFCRWLNLYVEHDKKIALGLIGGTLADVSAFNPEALDLIKRHPAVFEIIVRPFAHDISLLRTAAGFRTNVEHGLRALQAFSHVTRYFLPAEFMLTAEQIEILASLGIEGVFINATRFKGEVGTRIPMEPYLVNGTMGAQLRCIPIDGTLTRAYLDALHDFSASPWNEAVAAGAGAVRYSWRDGESVLILPQGIERERAWLLGESGDVERSTLRAASDATSFRSNEALAESQFHSYPVHAFTPWVREFRMLGFMQRLAAWEERLPRVSPAETVLWLQAINSDILSAVEKDSPVVTIRLRPGAEAETMTLWRSERGFEGEEYLVMLERGLASEAVRQRLRTSRAAHIVKLAARLQFFSHA